MKQYHIGIGKRGKTMVIETASCVDFLSCEIYDYMGERMVTKKHLNDCRYDLLSKMKYRRPDVYGGLKYAVVE